MMLSRYVTRDEPAGPSPCSVIKGTSLATSSFTGLGLYPNAVVDQAAVPLGRLALLFLSRNCGGLSSSRTNSPGRSGRGRERDEASLAKQSPFLILREALINQYPLL